MGAQVGDGARWQLPGRQIDPAPGPGGQTFGNRGGIHDDQHVHRPIMVGARGLR